MRKFLVLFMNTKFYEWLLIKIIPYIRFTTYYTSLRGRQYTLGFSLLQRGDIILTTDKRKLTTLLIGGEWTHASYCVDQPDFEVAEMTHTNFTKSYFFDLCKEADRVMILRCRDFDPDYVDKMIARCLSFQNASYDVLFEFGVKSLYCSELVYEADFERRLEVDLSDIAGLGTQYISPTGLRNAKNVWVVFDSDEVTDGK